MKNMIISALCAYIFYGFCEVRHFMIPIVAFFLFLYIVSITDEVIKDYMNTVRKGQRLCRKIDRLKGVRF